jgi:flagellar hook-associated protein 2
LATTDRWALDGVLDPGTDLATAANQTVSFDYDGTTYSVAFGTTTSTLNEIASGINTVASGKVAATVVNSGTDASPNWQLVLTAHDTGEDFRLDNLTSTVTGLVVNGASPNAQGVAQSRNNISVGQNAIAVIDGLTVERTSNDFTGVIAGVTLSLLQQDINTTVTLTVAPDKAAVKSKVKEFTDAYNEVVKYIKTQNSYDEESGAGGPLFGENALKTIQRTLNGVMFGQTSAQISADTTGYGTPRLVGIESNADGTLKINDKVMDAKMDADLAAFGNLFADTDGFDNGGAAVGSANYYVDQTTDTGLGDDLARAIDAVVKSYGNGNGQFFKGVFDVRVEAWTANIKQLNERIDQRETRLTRYEDQLKARFSALESLMARLQSQGASLGS